MIGRCKRLKVEEDSLKLDRLTDLPINVKHQIQEYLSIQEAAKMSVLSRPWRHVWASIPKFLFPAQFCNSKPSHKLIDIINTILSQHVGAIKTFLMNISSIPSSQHSVIDQWLLLLSRHGLAHLALKTTIKAPYNLPSYIYDVQLQSLDLYNCIFRPPSSFRSFRKLTSLSLYQVAFELDIATSFLWMPNLESLYCMACTGIQHLKIYAPKLLVINFFTSGIDTLQLGHFMDCQKLKTVALASENTQDEAMNLTNLLSGWPKICLLLLDSFYLKSIASGTDAESLSRLRALTLHQFSFDDEDQIASLLRNSIASGTDAESLSRLRALTLHQFSFDDEDQIASLLRMLSGSSNLNALQFSLHSIAKKKGEMEVNVNHFEGPTNWRQGLNKLSKLHINYFHGSKTELLFVRFILASAPLLLKAILMLDESVHEAQHLISKELMGFHRASPKSEIICKPLIRTKRVLH